MRHRDGLWRIIVREDHQPFGTHWPQSAFAEFADPHHDSARFGGLFRRESENLFAALQRDPSAGTNVAHTNQFPAWSEHRTGLSQDLHGESERKHRQREQRGIV